MEAIKKKDCKSSPSFYFGASDEARTRYLHLGKVALYQMSYTRNNIVIIASAGEIVNPYFRKMENFFMRPAESGFPPKVPGGWAAAL